MGPNGTSVREGKEEQVDADEELVKCLGTA